LLLRVGEIKTNIKMKKVSILLTTILIVSMALMSFKTKTATKYGGTASVRVKVVQADYNCNMKKVLNKAKDGDTRIIEVSVSCDYSTISDAKAALKSKIDYEKKCYEELANSIDYSPDSCN
jgi:hypothetical protein